VYVLTYTTLIYIYRILAHITRALCDFLHKTVTAAEIFNIFSHSW